MLLNCTKLTATISTNTIRGLRVTGVGFPRNFPTNKNPSGKDHKDDINDRRGRSKNGRGRSLHDQRIPPMILDHRSPLTTLLPEPRQEEPDTYGMKIPYPKEIVAYLNEFVIGQDLAKKTLAVGVYQHYKRIEFNQLQEEREFLREAFRDSLESKERKNRKKGGKSSDLTTFDRAPKGFGLQGSETDLMLEKSNIVLLGPSGSGKTYLTQKLAEALNVPFSMCDCTTLTQAGYVGDDVESVVQKLVAHSGGDIMRAEQGIVFLDEFDKIYTSSDPMHTGGNRDVSGKGVQQALLKLVEGSRVIIKHPLQPNTKVEVDTSNILFVASGAFSNLERIIAKRLDNRVLGFTAQNLSLNEDLDEKDEQYAAATKSELLAQTDHGDLINFGMVPELVGRFPVLVPFHALTERMLQDILTEPKNNIIEQSKKLFELDGIQLEFTDCAIQELARLAVKRKTGARALRSLMERVLLQAKYECPGTLRGTVTINNAVVRGETPYVTGIKRNEILKKS